MKYRLLTKEELVAMEKEFVEFLIVNGIVADEWEKIKKEKPSHAELMIEKFSEVVFQKIMSNVKFLEHIDKHEIRAFQCLKDRVVLVGIKAVDNADLDFRTMTDRTFIPEQLSANLEIYTAEKKYTLPREEELYQMTTWGCTIADNQLFNSLCLGLS